MQKRLLDRDALKDRGIKYSRPHLHRLVVAGRFPKPVKLGSRNMWLESEINRYLDTLIAQRDGQAVIEATPA